MWILRCSSIPILVFMKFAFRFDELDQEMSNFHLKFYYYKKKVCDTEVFQELALAQDMLLVVVGLLPPHFISSIHLTKTLFLS